MNMKSTMKKLMRLKSEPYITITDIPYIPMAMKDIRSYTNRSDYEYDCIKRIETIGMLRPAITGDVWLFSTGNKSRVKLRLDISNLDPDYAFPIDMRGIYRGLRHADKPVKVLGTLEIREGKIVLVVCIINEVEHLARCLKTLYLMNMWCLPNYSMYECYPERNEPLWDYIKAKRRQEEIKGNCERELIKLTESGPKIDVEAHHAAGRRKLLYDTDEIMDQSTKSIENPKSELIDDQIAIVIDLMIDEPSVRKPAMLNNISSDQLDSPEEIPKTIVTPIRKCSKEPEHASCSDRLTDAGDQSSDKQKCNLL